MAKFKVNIDLRDRAGGKLSTPVDLYDAFVQAGWTDNPGDGKAVLLDDGREVLNPIPFAPPIGFVEKPSVIDQVMAKLNARRVMQLQDDEEIDLKAELDDFDIDDDFDPRSVYEVTMQDEFPDVPREKENNDGGNSGVEKGSGEGSSAGASGGGDPSGDKKSAGVRKSRAVAGSEGEGGDDKASDPQK